MIKKKNAPDEVTVSSDVLEEIFHQLILMDTKAVKTELTLRSEIIVKANQTRESLERSLGAEIRLAMNDLETAMDVKLTKFQSDLYIKINPFLEEIEDNRIDRELTTQKFTDLENRVVVLEKAVN